MGRLMDYGEVGSKLEMRLEWNSGGIREMNGKGKSWMHACQVKPWSDRQMKC